MRSQEKAPEQRGEGQKQSKKPYSAPYLTVHGNIEMITGGKGSQASDSPMGSGGGGQFRPRSRPLRP